MLERVQGRTRCASPKKHIMRGREIKWDTVALDFDPKSMKTKGGPPKEVGHLFKSENSVSLSMLSSRTQSRCSWSGMAVRDLLLLFRSACDDARRVESSVGGLHAGADA